MRDREMVLGLLPGMAQIDILAVMKECRRLLTPPKIRENGRSTLSPDELDRLWAESAIEREFDRIVKLHDDNPHKQDSEWFKSVCRLAGIVKGSGRRYIQPSAVLVDLQKLSPRLKTKQPKDKTINYLWGRAYRLATPRYREKIDTP